MTPSASEHCFWASIGVLHFLNAIFLECQRVRAHKFCFRTANKTQERPNQQCNCTICLYHLKNHWIVLSQRVTWLLFQSFYYCFNWWCAIGKLHWSKDEIGFSKPKWTVKNVWVCFVLCIAHEISYVRVPNSSAIWKRNSIHFRARWGNSIFYCCCCCKLHIVVKCFNNILRWCFQSLLCMVVCEAYSSCCGDAHRNEQEKLRYDVWQFIKSKKKGRHSCLNINIQIDNM